MFQRGMGCRQKTLSRLRHTACGMRQQPAIYILFVLIPYKREADLYCFENLKRAIEQQGRGLKRIRRIIWVLYIYIYIYIKGEGGGGGKTEMSTGW